MLDFWSILVLDIEVIKIQSFLISPESSRCVSQECMIIGTAGFTAMQMATEAGNKM